MGATSLKLNEVQYNPTTMTVVPSGLNLVTTTDARSLTLSGTSNYFPHAQYFGGGWAIPTVGGAITATATRQGNLEISSGTIFDGRVSDNGGLTVENFFTCLPAASFQAGITANGNITFGDVTSVYNFPTLTLETLNPSYSVISASMSMNPAGFVFNNGIEVTGDITTSGSITATSGNVSSEYFIAGDLTLATDGIRSASAGYSTVLGWNQDSGGTMLMDVNMNLIESGPSTNIIVGGNIHSGSHGYPQINFLTSTNWFSGPLMVPYGIYDTGSHGRLIWGVDGNTTLGVAGWNTHVISSLSIDGAIVANGATGITTNYTIAAGDTLYITNGIIVGIGHLH